MKTLVYDTPVDSAEELVARIVVTVREIGDIPEEFQNIRFLCAGDVSCA